MRCELPILLRCCFCFPLRYGLLAWAYTKQITNIIWLVFSIAELCKTNSGYTVWGYVTNSIIVILTILDIAFNVFFLISAYTKDYKKMRIFYRYSVAQLFLNVGLLFLVLAWWIYMVITSPLILIFIFTALVPSLVISVLLIIIQGYLVILVRSEFVKLKNNAQFEFVNHAAMEKCSAGSDFEKQHTAPI